MRTRNLYTFKRRKTMDAFVSYGAPVARLISDSHAKCSIASSFVVLPG